MPLTTLKVPDIGDFKDVEVIEILVKVGDRIEADQSLVTIESDKASMEIPASSGGVVKELKIGIGDKISQGSELATVEGDGDASGPKPSVPPIEGTPTPAPTPQAAQAAAAATSAAGAPGPVSGGASARAAPTASIYSGNADIACTMVVLGSGPGGYSAAFRAADLGL